MTLLEYGLTSHYKHIIGHVGDGFYGSNDPTDSVKALKEVVILRIGFNPTGRERQTERRFIIHDTTIQL